MKSIIALDNGVTGTIAIIDDNQTLFRKTPVFDDKNFQKNKKGKYRHLKRLDVDELGEWFFDMVSDLNDIELWLEKPYTNTKPYDALCSAMRCHEATLIVCEQVFDRKPDIIIAQTWQKYFFGKDKVDTKEKSKEIGIKLFPDHESLINSHGDADSLLIAQYIKEINIEKEKK